MIAAAAVSSISAAQPVSLVASGRDPAARAAAISPATAKADRNLTGTAVRPYWASRQASAHSVSTAIAAGRCGQIGCPVLAGPDPAHAGSTWLAGTRPAIAAGAATTAAAASSAAEPAAKSRRRPAQRPDRGPAVSAATLRQQPQAPAQTRPQLASRTGLARTARPIAARTPDTTAPGRASDASSTRRPGPAAATTAAVQKTGASHATSLHEAPCRAPCQETSTATPTLAATTPQAHATMAATAATWLSECRCPGRAASSGCGWRPRDSTPASRMSAAAVMIRPAAGPAIGATGPRSRSATLANASGAISWTRPIAASRGPLSLIAVP